jgi:hypothetical protein
MIYDIRNTLIFLIYPDVWPEMLKGSKGGAQLGFGGGPIPCELKGKCLHVLRHR